MAAGIISQYVRRWRQIGSSLLHQEKSKRTLCHLVTSIDLIKLNKVDSEDDLLNLSRNVLKIAYLRPQAAARSPKLGKVCC